MRKPTRRSCKICKTKFTATYDNVWWCCPEHGFEYSQLLLAKKKLAADRKRKQ
ncbi:recombination protein NinG, partial [Citrobacter freundii]|uniref:recombination protein NinG n=2 Tax=Citrobacter freundii complex TaxID=1344959 RepID=UPI002B3B5B41|nr:recombination protein NinG [Citrobacter freundii]